MHLPNQLLLMFPSFQTVILRRRKRQSIPQLKVSAQSDLSTILVIGLFSRHIRVYILCRPWTYFYLRNHNATFSFKNFKNSFSFYSCFIISWCLTKLKKNSYGRAIIARFIFFLKRSLCLIYMITPLEFFTSALAVCLLLEFESQQVSSCLLDSSQYSGPLQ